MRCILAGKSNKGIKGDIIMINETINETYNRKKTICRRCSYHAILSGSICCDYLFLTGSRRPCHATECVEAGVFRTGKLENNRAEKAKRPLLIPKAPTEIPLTKQQAYYLANKERVKERAKQHYLENKEKAKERNRRWKQEHPEKAKEYKKKYREKAKLAKEMEVN